MSANDSDIVRYPLEGDGREYLLSVLNSCGTVSKDLAVRLSGDEGRVFAVLPPNVASEKITDYKSGGHFPSGRGFALPDGSRMEEIGSVVPSLAARLVGGSAFLVSFEAILTPADPLVTEAPNIGYFEEEVYSVLDLSSAGVGDVAQQIRDASIGYCAVNFVSRSGFTIEDEASRSLSRDKLREVAEGVDLCFAVAYDGEGCVAWSSSLTNDSLF